jgi:acid phosphatase class B
MSQLNPIFDIAVDDVTQIPQSKSIPQENIGPTSLSPLITSAVNTGVVQLKCIINGKCPFNIHEHVDDTILLNAQTISTYPPEVQSYLSSDIGSEGLYLTPRYEFRHTFIAGI